MNNWPNPFIEQRADPFILRHLSHYYFIGLGCRNTTGWRSGAR
ncbi:alpha-L-arabinofuranosidase II [Klebsiella pneumoniae]|uniref:Alpha-L-arabinofuranosidase II n=1 Tax=Klebsiella pneumoniae TaxID=573 RepID=A0A377XKG9_KLEPN|nr:alpha-L-arabinofuranosidase II [Klebsiella pneumoniae]